MNKKYLFPTATFLIFFIVVLISGMCLNNLVPVFHNGDVIGEDYKGGIRALTGFKQQNATGDYSIDLQGRCDPSGLALITMYYTPDTVLGNGTETGFFTYGSISDRILAAEIPPESFKFGADGTWSIHIDISGTSVDELVYMSICSLETAKTTISVYNILMPMIYGILLTISIYGFLLYLSKRDWTLLLFSFYTLCIFIWCFTPCLIYHFGVSGTVLQIIYDYSFDFAVVLGMATCISFCELELKGRWRLLGKWYRLLALCLLFSLIYNSLSQRAGDILLFAVYTAGAVILVIACGNAERKPWIVLCGLSITQALRLVALLCSTQLFQLSFYFAMLRLMRLLTLPYLVCCMVYINSTFASKFKEAEALAGELEQVNKMLDKKVEERTGELIEQQQIRTNLMTNIFHDLRTPLLIMRGCTDRIKDERSYDEETVQILDDRLSFITDMTEELFATVKLEDKSLLMETEPVYLKPMLRKITDAFQAEANKKGVGIVCICEANAVAWGDETWLSRAFQNLIANAIYYSKPGGGDVTVTMQVDFGQSLVSVSDHGVGIAPEDLDKIFDRYYRISGTKKHKSSGLGLSIAAGVVAQHNGSITAESKVGIGTTFLVKLPLWSTEPDMTEEKEEKLCI